VIRMVLRRNVRRILHNKLTFTIAKWFSCTLPRVICYLQLMYIIIISYNQLQTEDVVSNTLLLIRVLHCK
jgi:hypothetical protein